MTWKALLLGDTFDLELLSTIFSEEDLKVSADGQGNYFLESSTFDSPEAAETMAEAQRLLVRMNGVAMVQDPSYQAVRLSGRFQSEGGRHHTVVVAATATGRLRVTGAVVGTGGMPVEPKLPPPRAWLRLAQANPDVDDVLRRLGSLDHDWLTLSNVVEVIEADVGSIPKRGWATDDRLSLFTRSANHQGAAGDSARHARATTEPPKNPMTIAEARRFVLGLVQAWASWRSRTRSQGSSPCLASNAACRPWLRVGLGEWRPTESESSAPTCGVDADRGGATPTRPPTRIPSFPPGIGVLYVLKGLHHVRHRRPWRR